MSLPTLQSFEFDVITVDAQGQETSCTRGQAESFTEDLGSGVGLDMVSLSGGSFVMGSPESEAQRNDREGPQHLVRLSPFCLSKSPVTQAQWFAVSGLPQVNCDLASFPSCYRGLTRPVERVSWYEAVECCDRLSQRTGRQYRLPSEAEWEFACRAGTTTPFHFGETLTTALANYRGTDNETCQWGSGAYGQGPQGSFRAQTTDVGSFPPNAFGFYDLHGNVWEWCLDHWHESYEGAPSDGSAWVEGGDSDHALLRGGAWGFIPLLCRSACRFSNRPSARYNTFGFRVVCAAP